MRATLRQEIERLLHERHDIAALDARIQDNLHALALRKDLAPQGLLIEYLCYPRAGLYALEPLQAILASIAGSFPEGYLTHLEPFSLQGPFVSFGYVIAQETIGEARYAQSCQTRLVGSGLDGFERDPARGTTTHIGKEETLPIAMTLAVRLYPDESYARARNAKGFSGHEIAPGEWILWRDLKDHERAMRSREDR